MKLTYLVEIKELFPNPRTVKILGISAENFSEAKLHFFNVNSAMIAVKKEIEDSCIIITKTKKEIGMMTMVNKPLITCEE